MPQNGKAALRGWQMYDELFCLFDPAQAESLAAELGITGRDFRGAAETVRKAVTIRRGSA